MSDISITNLNPSQEKPIKVSKKNEAYDNKPSEDKGLRNAAKLGVGAAAVAAIAIAGIATKGKLWGKVKSGSVNSSLEPEMAKLKEEKMPIKLEANSHGQEKVVREAEEKAVREVEEKAVREVEEKAAREAEEKVAREAEEKAVRETEEKAVREAEEKAAREAEEKAAREAEEKAVRKAEEKAAREAEKALIVEKNVKNWKSIINDINKNFPPVANEMEVQFDRIEKAGGVNAFAKELRLPVSKLKDGRKYYKMTDSNYRLILSKDGEKLEEIQKLDRKGKVLYKAEADHYFWGADNQYAQFVLTDCKTGRHALLYNRNMDEPSFVVKSIFTDPKVIDKSKTGDMTGADLVTDNFYEITYKYKTGDERLSGYGLKL